MSNPFIWKTGAPSCMRTATSERDANKLTPAGMALDVQGRAIVQLEPRSVGAVSITSEQDTFRNQRLARGRSI